MVIIKILMNSQSVLRLIKLGPTHMTPKAKEGTTLMMTQLKLQILNMGESVLISKLTRVTRIRHFNILRPLQRDPQNLIRAIAATQPLLRTMEIKDKRLIRML